MTASALTSHSVTNPTGRFAPSPTGPLHYGSLLAAIASYLNVKSRNGTWLVRIDDLDPPREVVGAASDILQTLENFGLHWDKEILYQSRRLKAYDEALAKLQEKQLTYPCSCSRKDIVQRGEAVYSGHCRNGHITGRERYAIRLKVPMESLGWHDMIQGSQFSSLFQDHGDFVVRRADGLHAYHLAVVLDDDFQNVTESIRGADLLPSTSAQMYLQKALDIEPPQYGHIPVAVNTRGEKLSKQTGAEPVSMHDPAKTLFKALQDLGQGPPPDLQASSIRDIIEWGTQNWVLQKIPSGQRL